MNKWAPFNSTIDGNKLANSINNEKKRFIKPSFSDEQLERLEKTISEAFYSKSAIELKLYKNGYEHAINGVIKQILKEKGIIILNNRKQIHFCEILSAKKVEF